MPFPYSDLSANEVRPALVITNLKGWDVICCQITSSKPADDSYATLTDKDLAIGTIKNDSFIRANKIFTLEQKLIIKTIGRLRQEKIDEVIQKILDTMQL